MRRAAFYSRANSYSRSFNAHCAEDEGRMPLTRAKRAVAQQHGCSQPVAAAMLELLHDGEWHHVGKYAARVAYYDSEDSRLAGVIRHILAWGGAKKWAERRARVRAERRGRRVGYTGAYRNMRDCDSLPRHPGRIMALLQGRR